MSNNIGQKIKKGVKTATKLIVAKFQLATIKWQLIIGGALLLILLLIVGIVGIITVILEQDENQEEGYSGVPPGQAEVSEDVLQYKDKVKSELSEYGMEEYTEVLLALMMQESGGKGNDPMQSSESYCGSIGCITDPDISIEKGVLHFKKVMEKANNDVKLALQSYNFGGGFIDYVNDRGGEYTFDLAISFSQQEYKKQVNSGNGHQFTCLRAEGAEYDACFGDIMYVESVLAYLPSTTEGATEVVEGDLNSPLKQDLIVTSTFSWRDIGEGDEHHNGLDLDCNAPDSIHAAKDGEVVFAGESSGYGNLVTLKHGASDFTSYAHMSDIVVSVGDNITGGEQVGVCGSTGRSTADHLHFEIKTEMWGGFIDPQSYLGL